MFKKKIIISIIIFVLLLALLDFIAYRKIIQNQLSFMPKEARATAEFPSWFWKRFQLYDETTMKWFEEKGEYRPAAGMEYKKPAIWLFGCSFVYGIGINWAIPFEETFGYILSNYTKRPVFNRAYPSWGVQHMYYQLEKGDIFNELPKPEYVIFTFIADHARRTQKLVYDPWSDGEYLRYKVKNGRLEKINAVLVPLWKFYPVKLWLTYLEYYIRLNPKNHDKNFDLVKEYLIESNNLLKAKYPDVKFIVLKYDGNDGFDRWFIETDRWKELKKEGITVIDADDLVNANLKDKKYTDPDGYHPNKIAWDLISKKLAKDVLH